ncbi:hypothetical protein [Pseudooceanicola spongiae]|uniref:Uncharacterized protein n=1 Tax=Pseudooceanicola spongiae TaxID=2613965 RepID=A0A7L9WJJ6_9RHOB|nr:hypothetical protein [Pseudooceanicola spongiae]QOL80555.1 hypothetical protein F3W81_06860 [Pseudooceanicola spongiae]
MKRAKGTDQAVIQHISSVATMPVTDIYLLCARLSSDGRCRCSGRGLDRCAGLRGLLAEHGSVDAAHDAEIQRMAQVARNART